MEKDKWLEHIPASVYKSLCGLKAALGYGDGYVSAADVIEKAADRILADNVGAGLFEDPRDQTAEYLLQLRRFVSKNEIPRDLASRLRKAGEELGELGEAMVNGNLAPIMSEAGDGINVLIDILLICAGDGPRASTCIYPFLIQNLKDKAEKYDAGDQRLGDRL